ncbi:MAG: c-type cytochrome [Chthonomonadales bacterium]
MGTMRSALCAWAICGVATLALVGLSFAAPGKPKPKKVAKPAASASIATGKKIFAGKCAGCHAATASEAKSGKPGPALTHVAKFMKPAAMEAKIRNPKKSNPNSIMPAFGPQQISAQDMKALIAYLSTLK